MNGLKGGRPKANANPEEPKESGGLNKNPSKPKKPVSVIVSVSDSVIEKEKEKENNAFGSDFKKNIFNTWLEYRTQIKKRIRNQKTMDALIKKFQEKSEEEIAYVVNKSIENQWVGLFWEEYNKVKGNSSRMPQTAADRLKERMLERINEFNTQKS